MPGPALAAAKPKVAAAVVTAAQREFDAGNFARAGELFLEIYRQDSSQIAALYNAARAHHLAGKVDKAAELYAELLATGKLEPPVAAKVEGFAREVQNKRAEQAVERARQAEGAGQFSLAAERWAEVRKLQPDRAEWLLRQARAEQLAGHAEAARALFREFLAKAEPADPLRADAEKWHGELSGGTPVPVHATPLAQTPVEVRRPAPVAVVPQRMEAKSAPILAYSLLGGGLLAAVAGGAVGVAAARDDAALQDRMKARDSNGWISGVSYSAAASEAARIEGQYRMGWILGGVGVAALGTGTWLWLRGSATPVAVVPLPSGFGVAGNF